MTEPSQRSWVLALERPSSDPCQRLGGLSLALRLALDAQAAGASAIIVPASAAAARRALSDPRLRLPVLDRAPAGVLRVALPASTLVHRALFRQLVASEPARVADELRVDGFRVDAAYAFEPIDVSDPQQRRAAERALFRSLRKAEDGWTSRHLNRHLSLALSRLLARTPLRPNQVSVGILAIGLGGALLAARGELVLGALLFQAQSVLDGCDGELSRVTHQGSLTGEWLDTIGDDLTNYGFFGGAGFGLYQATGWLPYLVAGLVTVTSGVIASAFEYRYLARIGSGDLLKYPLSRATSEVVAGRSGGSGLSALAPLFKRDTFVLLTLVAAIAGWLGGMLCVFAAAAIGVLVAVIRTELRLAREASRAA